MQNESLYLSLGGIGIGVQFSSPRLADRARKMKYFTDDFDGTIIRTIIYIEDDTVSDLIQGSRQPNVVQVMAENLGEDRTRILLRMFDRHNFTLQVNKQTVEVRYPADAPLRLMLDDVLQAAIQPALEEVGGFILHGSCAVKDNSAIVFMGNSGAGKSCTALNLSRFGFQLYADDAVLVTPRVNSLWVWPLAREFSIRPLAFKLFQEQGIRLDDYTPEGGKYYFKVPEVENNRGALLKQICFLEISGGVETVVSKLDCGQALKLLLREDRHFSFMNRKSAAIYSRIMAERVPLPLSARVGMDLNSQGKVFEEIISGGAPDLAPPRPANWSAPTREEKTALIGQAWNRPGREPIEDIIPLIGDYDLKVFAVALGFLQNFPLARLEPFTVPVPGRGIPAEFAAPWIRGNEWLEGCRRLIRQTRVEVFRRFAFSWIKSAPVLCAFLSLLTEAEPAKHREVQSAWHRYRREKDEIGRLSGEQIGVHVADFQTGAPGQNPAFTDWGRTLRDKFKSIHVYLWLSRLAPEGGEKWAAFCGLFGDNNRLTVIPVIADGEETIGFSLRFLRWALESGQRARISRCIPLCKISGKEADFLLGRGVLESVEGKAAEHFQLTAGGNLVKDLGDLSSYRDVVWPGSGISLQECPFPACAACGLHRLRLCRGSFLPAGRG